MVLFSTNGLRNVILIGGIIQIIFWIFTILFAVISPIELEGSDWTNFWLVILLLGIPTIFMFIFSIIVKVSGDKNPGLRGYVIVFMSFTIVFILGDLGYIFWRVVVLTRCYDNDTCTSTRTIYIIGASVAGFMLLWSIAIFAVTVTLLAWVSANMMKKMRESGPGYRLRGNSSEKGRTDTKNSTFVDNGQESRIGSSPFSSSGTNKPIRRSPAIEYRV